MSNEALLFYKKLGLKVESDFAAATITPATELLALREDGIVVGLSPQQIRPGRISGRASKKDSILGTLAPKYSIPCYGYPQGGTMDLLKVAMGTVASVEVASFVVTNASNDSIDFTEDGGAEVTADLTAGTYVAGASSAVAGSFCALIKTQMEAVNGASTYTVAYSPTTKKFTITKSTGVFVIKWTTGTNAATSAKALLGFAADSASAIAAVSDSTVASVWDHTFSLLDAITYGLSAGITTQVKLADGKVFDILDGVVDMLKLSFKPNQELWIDAEIEARKVLDSVATLASLTEEATSPFLYSQLVFSVGAVNHSISSLEVSLSNNYKKDAFVNSQFRSKFYRNGFREVKGSFEMDLTDSRAYAIYDAFIAGTQPALVATFTGATGSIKTTFANTLTATLAKVAYDLEAVPGGGGESAPAGVVGFTALDDGTNGEIKIVVRNSEGSI